VAAFALTAVVVFLVMWFRARSRHWTPTIVPAPPDQASEPPVHSTVSLRSEHYHHALNLYCLVRDRRRSYRSSFKYPDHWLRPGESVGMEYPSDFPGASWPEPGEYKVAWLTDVAHGVKPTVIAKQRWHVAAPDPQPPFDHTKYVATLGGTLITRE